ncbi:tumor necrosis factor receptor superfamily member 26 [Labrus mixtus]|uniref:tumor necrosis factor receptor superfamily member 26 n=1 Tax=Labrus mixtus TaxID=508554 RepID=UPI0029C0838E|nr:tumor necrosis factor receptor superfamily member 26 [Labrus mixtus]
MTADSNKVSALFIVCVLIFTLVSFPSASCQTDAGSPCEHGTYRHEERDCCRCGVGNKLKAHCVANLQYGECEPCEPGTFSSQPSQEKFCEPCKHCHHPNENLEEAEPCTPPRNAKCRCKPDHYCIGDIKNCLLCHPCKKCGAEGIKVKCAGNNNTVCNEEIKGGNQAAIIAGIVVAVLLLIIAAAAAVFIWRKKSRSGGQVIASGTNGNVELLPLRVPEVDLQHLIPDIATAIGWKDMKKLAIRSHVPTATIETCELDHPGDSGEQTCKLLTIWVEKEGRQASKRLIEMLNESNKKVKAERVMDLLREAGRANAPA